ncbi:hypothetical protein, partial [Aquitalea magnusonii]|uniref:hypothetical protein n=1 Tax=Aquitalea magnusonii TaxID=332411 RepID=UPI001956CE18
ICNFMMSPIEKARYLPGPCVLQLLGLVVYLFLIWSRRRICNFMMSPIEKARYLPGPCVLQLLGLVVYLFLI